MDSRYRQIKFLCVLQWQQGRRQVRIVLNYCFIAQSIFSGQKKSLGFWQMMAKFHHNSHIILKVCMPLLQAFLCIDGWYEIWDVYFCSGFSVDREEIWRSSVNIQVIKNVFMVLNLKQTSITENYYLSQYEAYEC